MATIEKRGPFQWRAKIRKKGYPSETRTFETKAKAERWARKVESDMDSGTFVSYTEAEQTTFGELLSRYRDEMTTQKKGHQAETIRINAMIKNRLFARPLLRVTSNDIATYRDQRLRKVSPSTVIKEITLISHAIDIGIKEWGIYIPTNPAKLIRKPKPAKPRERRFGKNEEIQLHEALDKGTRNPWIKPLVEIAVETAMRRGELLSLDWDNIDLEEQTAYLPDTKNGDSRTVPLSKMAINILRDLPRNNDNLVFPISFYSLKKAFERAVKRAGIENLRFHDLRHEATCMLRNRKSPYKTAAYCRLLKTANPVCFLPCVCYSNSPSIY